MSDDTTNILSEPLPKCSEDVKKTVSEPNLAGFVANVGLSEVADQTNAGISEQLKFHQEKTKPPKKSDPVVNPKDINLQPIKWFETNMFGKVKLDSQGNPKRRNGRPKKPRNGDKLVNGGTWPPATASTVQDDNASTINQGQGQQPEPEAKKMDLGEEAGEVLSDHLERIGQAMGGENGKPTPAEKKVLAKAMSATLGTWSVWPPLALLVFAGLYLARVKITSVLTTKNDKEVKKDGSQTHSVPRDNGQRQNSPGKTTQYRYQDG
ncbi:MAG: hypothetical protein JKX85_00535 [Phycisphaeraceae bacterium]|nr:hypothetical protein [Phycisphaeraceae bacterium]